MMGAIGAILVVSLICGTIALLISRAKNRTPAVAFIVVTFLSIITLGVGGIIGVVVVALLPRRRKYFEGKQDDVQRKKE